VGGASWARLEGNYHYPSDVLLGAALGNFIGRFLNDAFIGPNDPRYLGQGATRPRGRAGESAVELLTGLRGFLWGRGK
jgi:hypothetical protein